MHRDPGVKGHINGHSTAKANSDFTQSCEIGFARLVGDHLEDEAS